MVPPRGDINAPDLYIPAMAFITYIITAGVSLGVDSRFAPDLLGILSSQVFGWLLLEICVLALALHLLNIQSSLNYLDLLAYSGYKFVQWVSNLCIFSSFNFTEVDFESRDAVAFLTSTHILYFDFKRYHFHTIVC